MMAVVVCRLGSGGEENVCRMVPVEEGAMDGDGVEDGNGLAVLIVLCSQTKHTRSNINVISGS